MNTEAPAPRSSSPRMAGIREHLERVRLFGVISNQITDVGASFRLMLAAIYSCRAFSELLLEAAEHQEFRKEQRYLTRQDVEADLMAGVPFYFLIERIRIHDFHRFGISPPNPRASQIFMGGPITLKAQRGSAAISLGEKGIEQLTEGASSVKLKRPLLIQNGLFFDDESSTYVDLTEVLNAFIAAAPTIVDSYDA